MALKVATPPTVIPAKIAHVGKVEEGNYGSYRSVRFEGNFTPGMDSVKKAGELWRRVPCSDSDDMAVGMGMILTLAPGKNGGMLWQYALDPDAPPVTAPTAAQQQQAPASTGSGYQALAPAATGGYSPAQPLDRVGEPGREEALNAELTMRLKLMNRTVQAATKSLAVATGNWVPVDANGEPDPKGRVQNPELLDQSAIHGLATSVMIGLFQQGNYFGGGSSQNEP